MAEKQGPEYIVLPTLGRIDYNWTAGRVWSIAKKAMRDEKKLITTQCPSCKTIYLPPQPVCGECYVFMGDNWIELAQTGTLLNFTGPTAIPLFDPAFGKHMVDEYAHGSIELDGGGVVTMHRIGEVDPNELKVGMRVEAVWKNDGRVGRLEDLIYFRPIRE